MQLPLHGATVTRVSFDSSVLFLFDRAGQIRIECPLSFTDGNGTRSWDERKPSEVTGSLADLMWAIVHEALVDESTGTLAIRFQDGRRIDVAPDDVYEAWSYAGERGHKVISGAGGDLLVFDPRGPQVTT